jgi:hypothetical protein
MLQQPSQPARWGDGVVVEQNEIATARARDSLVARGCEPLVVTVEDPTDRRVALFEHVEVADRPIG